MERTILQVPITKQLKQDAEKRALAQGFSSLQEAVRIFLNKLANGAMKISFEKEEEVIQLSEKAIKRYDKITDDMEKGINVYEAKDVNDLMKQLKNAS